MIKTDNILTSTLVLSAENNNLRVSAEVVKSLAENNIIGGANQHGQIANGRVYRDATVVATFHKYNNISIAYRTADEVEQTEILSAVQSFCTDIKDYVDKSVINVLTEEEKQ